MNWYHANRYTYTRRAFTACFLFLVMKASSQELLKGLSAEGAQLVKLPHTFKFTEGPACDKKGNIFFTDQPNDDIWKYGADGKLSLFMHGAGRSNGLYFDHDGRLLSCADSLNQLWSIGMDKSVKIILTSYQGKLMNGPNDLWPDASGGIYFTDPYYQRDWWTRKKPDLARQDVYYLPKGASEPIVVDSSYQQPNGIVGTPDGKYLYVADIAGNKTWRYAISGKGKLTDKTFFAPMGSDGLTLDEKGNVYFTGKGVTVFNKDGQQIGHIDFPEPWTANICFGGKDRKTLLVTSFSAVYTLRMNVRGVE